jgi:AcrR family transcriptional regulator
MSLTPMTQAERRRTTRANLLTSARKEFASSGYNGTSADRIAARAGCTKGALYNHFGSKEGLFLALMEEQLAARIDQARGERSDAAPFDKEISLLFLEFVCAAARDPKLKRKLATRLGILRGDAAERLGGDEQLAATLAAAANGASIEALIFGPEKAAMTFEIILASLLTQ